MALLLQDPVHDHYTTHGTARGDEHMKECSMCGAEFCKICFPKSSVCPDCADTAEDEDDEDAEADPDFDDVKKLDDVLEDDEEEEEEEEEDAGRRY